MNQVKRCIRACMLIFLVTIFVQAASTAHAASLTCGAWSIVKSPSPGSSIDKLYAVAKVSASNVWAVGTADDTGIGGLYQTLTEHWNGTTWNYVKSPNVGTNSNLLKGVAALSSTNVWAVGYYYPSSGVTNTLVEHWNGTKWSVVTSPNVGTNSNILFGVAAVSASNIWAVGEYSNSGSSLQTLIEHWNGTAWSIIPSPSPSLKGENALNAVAAVSSSDVWAVGYYQSNTDGSFQPLIEQWNGGSWNVVSSPSGGGFPLANYLNGIVAVSASDVWAVGDYGNFSNSSTIKTLVEQWNGASWSIVPSPNGGSGNYLYGATAVDASHVWAVGSYYSVNTPKTLTEFYC